MLTKEVKDILEGIHFFLVEGLKDESLSGKVECLRRGLLLQLEGLRTTYPFLHFTSSVEPNVNNIRNASTLSFLNVDQQIVNSSRMSTSSSSSTNYSSTGCSNGSSTGYSGDGVVMSHNDNTSSATDKKIENYEDFEDIETCSQLTTTTTQSQRSSSDFPCSEFLEERDEESYADAVEPVSFRILVGKCDHHGVLSKRSKGILPGMRNSKTFRCVLTGSLLYLYLKESDDKQKKVIDLAWYRVAEMPVEENKFHSRRRDFAFQLVGLSGRKTHTFFTSKKTSMERWVKCLREAISTSEVSKDFPLLQKSQLAKVDEKFPAEVSSDHDDDEDEEFYEELNPEDVVSHSSTPQDHPPSLWKPPSVSYPTSPSQSQSDDVSDYYSVPEEGDTIRSLKHIYCNQRRIPPERPPLPNILRDNLQQKRPLPKAPETLDRDFEGPDNLIYDEIYYEIDDPKSEDNFHESMNDILIDSSSLSKEIFDTINKRVPSSPEKSFNGHLSDISFRTIVSVDAENYDVPNDASSVLNSSPSWKINHRPVAKAPSLPPKGTRSSVISDEESDYKVPSSTLFSENIYHVPSSLPVPVKAVVETASNGQHSGRYDANSFTGETEEETVADETLSDCVNNNKESVLESVCAVLETEQIVNDNVEQILSESNSVTSLKSKLLSTTEKRPKTDEEIKINSSNSVKDLIAKLNQTDELTETSQQTFCNSSFRKSKLSLNCFENAVLVECKNKIEISRSVKAIKNDLENKEKLNLEKRDSKESNILFKPEESCGGNKTEIINPDSQCHNVQINNEPGSSSNVSSAQENRVYIAKFAYVSSTPDELSFSRGDEIVVMTSPAEERFWRGALKGREGLVPKEYLRMKD